MKFYGQWFLALLIAGLFSLHNRNGWRRIVKALGLLLVAWHHRHQAWVTSETADQRMACCERCPVFYDRLRTCGSPLRKELRGLGCHCFMPAKVKLADATCWIDDNAPAVGQYGWNRNV